MANQVGINKDIQVLPSVQPAIPDHAAPTAGEGIRPSTYKQLGQATEQDLAVTGEELQDEVLPEQPALWKVATVVAPTARDWGNAIYEDFKFERDIYYNSDADAQEFFETHGERSREEVAYIHGARSYEDMQFRQQRILDRRDDNEVLAAHPITGTIASVIDADLPLAFAPAVGQIGGAAKLGRLAQRGMQAAALGGGAYGLNQLLEDGSTRTQSERNLDSLTFGLVGLFSPIKYEARATGTALDQMVDTELKAIAQETTETANRVGSAGTTNVLGHDVKMPISQPIDTSKLAVPDWAVQNKVVAALQSSGDYMWYLTKGDANHPANKILAAPRTQGDNAPYATAPVQATLEAKLVGVEDAINDAAMKMYGTSPNRFFGRKDHTIAQYQVTEQFGQAMQRLDQDVLWKMNSGQPVDKKMIHQMIDESNVADEIKAIQKAYVDSGFAETALSRAKQAGLLENLDDAAALHSRATYMPVKHSYERMNNLIKAGKVSEDQLYNFLGKQIMRMYPEMQQAMKIVTKAGTKTVERKFQLTAKQLGMNFFENQQKLALGLSEVQTAGLTKDQMITLLRKSGVDDENLNKIADTIYKGTQDAGTGVAKQFRKRLSWDWNMKFSGKDGGEYSLGDLVDGNAYMNLTDYTRTMSKRIGLAQYGIKTTADLDNILQGIMKDLPADVDIATAKRFLQNVRAQALGHPMGEAVPETIRSLNTVAGATFLSNSGLYNVVDMATQVAKMGLVRTLPEIMKGLKNTINPLKKLSKNEANDLYDVLTGLLSTDGRWRNITTRYADDFEVTTGVHEAVQYYGQATRFMNLSEYVKRMQIGMIGGVVTTAFKNAAKGSAKDIKYMKETLKMSDELTDAIIKEHKAHGTNIDMWSNDVRMAMEQKVFYEADNLAHTIRSGEIPAFMEHSSVGKIIFPFMSFAFAMQQKVLRNTYLRDGAAGVALLAAVQFPTAALIGMAKNVKNGKEPEEDLAKASVNALSMLGTFSYPLEIIMNGGLNSNSAALAPVSNAMTLGQKAVSGDLDLRSIKNATPLGSLTGLDLFISAIED